MTGNVHCISGSYALNRRAVCFIRSIYACPGNMALLSAKTGYMHAQFFSNCTFYRKLSVLKYHAELSAALLF